MKLKKLSSLLFFFTCLGFAQNSDCACCSQEYDQFDFWVGDWEVFNEENVKIGENLILKLEDNCILNENWESVNNSSGKSYNYYDPSDKTWNQLWISNTGNILKLKGSGTRNTMTLKSEITSSDKGDYYNQIKWTKNENGSVTQEWEIYNPDGVLINTAFKGIYRKKSSD
ncbi:hypothetical protein [Christiangramia sabulilitoris]|uniref:Uncharacterized protein n=1 Tax=Christiangramia sabulilitoris TaxID=2583991 RepID=A0A550I850_9FLAO|nr:hypothetical protein [Christiangramia sabulilitoris]TRO67131.1 hypothetical protein FGM01_04405 [Christiangramia sabulilitoris]